MLTLTWEIGLNLFYCMSSIHWKDRKLFPNRIQGWRAWWGESTTIIISERAPRWHLRQGQKNSLQLLTKHIVIQWVRDPCRMCTEKSAGVVWPDVGSIYIYILTPFWKSAARIIMYPVRCCSSLAYDVSSFSFVFLPFWNLIATFMRVTWFISFSFLILYNKQK